MTEPSEPIKAYLREIGRKGGQKSRRSLDPAQARRMVALREARKAFSEYRNQCFWSCKPDLAIGMALVPMVIKTLKAEGDRRAYEKARSIQRLWGTP